MTPTPRSGAQHLIRAAAYEATVASIGASLRRLTHGGRDLVVPYDADEVRPFYRGATLAPWPNRVVDGRYTFEGRAHELALTEPQRSHALHGLAVWLDFEPVGPSSTDRVTLAATVQPQAGYPWRLLVETTYTLDERGLRQSVRGTNLDNAAAPWGTGPHPYLVAGASPLDTWVLSLPAEQVLEVTDDRVSPLGLRPVPTYDPGRFDFRVPRPLDAVEIDHAYTGLIRDEAGLTTVHLTTAAGDGVALTWDEDCPWVQIHTADRPGGEAEPGHRAGLAVEPMTCAPDAFNADHYDFDTGLVVLQPGESHEVSWRLSALVG